jgi:multiple antibiotic resistance protein
VNAEPATLEPALRAALNAAASPGGARLFAETFVTLFVIMDPPGILPVFLALTARMERPARARAARQATVVAFCVIVVFAIFGRRILDYLHVSLPALQLAGGLLLLLIALELLTGKDAQPEAPDKVNVALVPLGTPLLAGPGAIVATMVFVSSADGAVDYLSIGAAIVAIHLVIWLTMKFADVLHRLLRDSGIMLVTRIAGLLLSAIAVQLVADAVAAFIEEYS